MLKILKYFLVTLILLISILSTKNLVFADDLTCLNEAGNYCMNTMLGDEKQDNSLKAILGKNKDIPTLIGTIVGTILSLLGVIFSVLIIYGGFIWMLAGGNEQNVEKAKNILTQAIIGLVIVLMAYAITSFIGDALNK